MHSIPTFKNRSPIQIVTEINFFESSGRAYKALSWLDFATEHNNISALEYASLETRLAIEQLLFEQLIVGVGTELEKSDYKKCCGNANKLNEIIERLIPRYERLIDFTKVIAPSDMPVTKWDNRLLIKYSGKVSTYLHWSGGLDVTVQSEQWFSNGLAIVAEAANYIWSGITTGNTAIIVVDKLQPEIHELWDMYSEQKITLEQVIEKVKFLDEMLDARLNK